MARAKTLTPDDLKDFIRTRAASFLERPNINSVGIGRKIKDGKPQGELSIQFTVDRKLSPETLEAAGLESIPASFEINGVTVPTDVVQRSFKPAYRLVTQQQVVKDRRKIRLDPIQPGCSVGHPSITAGTLGCLVYDRNDGALCMLSNWHVLHGAVGKIGDVVLQPGKFDDNRVSRNQVGVLVRSHLGPAGDCAIARIVDRAAIADTIEIDTPTIEELGVADLDDKVVKSGRTTGVTYGVVTRVHTISKINYDGVGEQQIGGFEIGPDPDKPAQDGEISKGGDSGSAWLARTDSGKPGVMLGLHFAGESEGEADEHAIACYAHSVFEKLEISLQPPTARQETVEGLGYDAGFLGHGFTVPVPTATKPVRDDLVDTDGGSQIDHTHFSLAMSKSTRLAKWVAWNIDGGSLKSLNRKGLKFVNDPDLDPDQQIGDELYSGNRLDRGHLARRADLLWGSIDEARRANAESFYFSNITPQHEAFNQSQAGGLWGSLENAIFDELEIENLKVSVMAGPLFKDGDPVYREYRIPRDFWKLIAFVDGETKNLTVKAYIVTQDDLMNNIESLGLEPFKLFRVPLSELQSRTGLRFPKLDKATEPETLSEKAGGARTAARAIAIIRQAEDVGL